MRRLILFLSLFVLSCHHRLEDPCQVDSFFCRDPEEWEGAASQLGTERVLELHILSQRLYHPSPDVFSNVLGARGEEAIVLVVNRLRTNPELRSDLFYMPIFHAVIFRSRFDFCRSRYYQLAKDALLESRNGSAERARLERFCSSEFGRVPANNGLR